MRPEKIQPGEYKILMIGASKSFFSGMLNEKIGFKLIVPGKYGILGVQVPIEKIKSDLMQYLSHASGIVKLYITGGDGSLDSEAYNENLSKTLYELQRTCLGNISIENHANEEIHIMGLTLCGDEIL